MNHCRIRSKQEKGQTRYHLIETNSFDSLYSLITYYRTHPLRSQVKTDSMESIAFTTFRITTGFLLFGLKSKSNLFASFFFII